MRAAAIFIAIGLNLFSLPSWAGAEENHAPVAQPSAVSTDTPGPAYGFPQHNTFGYATTYDNFVPLATVPVWDVGGGSPPSSGELRVDVEMGGFNRLHEVTDIADYWMDVDFTATIFTWANGDGKYCPTGSVSVLCAAVGFFDDDPCPVGPFPLFDVWVQPGGSTVATHLRTVMGGNMQHCTPGSLGEDHPFDVLPPGNPTYPSDGFNRFRIPKGLLANDRNVCCYLTIIFKPADLVLPAYTSDHTKSQDGVKLEVRSVMVQLVAPPMVIEHGWVKAFGSTQAPSIPIDPYIDPLLWQGTMRTYLRQSFKDHFGQDPWSWASSKGEPVLANTYDRKADLRKSAVQLGTAVANLKTAMSWTGKVWLHGHSLGGLVSRYYIEELQGYNQVEKFSQDSSPNTGAFLANINTRINHVRYADPDAWALGRYFFGNNEEAYWYNPGSWPMIGPGRCWVHFGMYEWKPWYIDGVRAQRCQVGFVWSGNTPEAGTDKMADFELTPAGPSEQTAAGSLLGPLGSYFGTYFGSHNQILYDMNEYFHTLAVKPGSLPPYFAHSIAPNNLQPPNTLPPYFTVRGSRNGLDSDYAVRFKSATLNGAIPSRTLDTPDHELTPRLPETSTYLARYYGNLNLDSGYPIFCRPGVSPGPNYSFIHNIGDDTTLDGGSGSTDDQPDLHFEEYGGRAPSCPPTPPGGLPCSTLNEGDERDPASTTGADRYEVFVDAQTSAKFTVHTALDDPPLQLDAVSPTGQPAPAATTDDTGWTRIQTIQIPNPQAGKWIIHVGPAPGQQYYLGLYWDAALELTAGTAVPSYAAQAPITVGATLKGLGVSVLQANVFLEVPDVVNGGELHIPLQTSGFPANETWSGTWLPPTILGPSGQAIACDRLYMASITATGTRGASGGLPSPVVDFSRSVEFEIKVNGNPADAALCNPAPPGGSGGTTVLVAVPVMGVLLGGGFGGGFLVGRRRRPGLLTLGQVGRR